MLAEEIGNRSEPRMGYGDGDERRTPQRQLDGRHGSCSRGRSRRSEVGRRREKALSWSPRPPRVVVTVTCTRTVAVADGSTPQSCPGRQGEVLRWAAVRVGRRTTAADGTGGRRLDDRLRHRSAAAAAQIWVSGSPACGVRLLGPRLPPPPRARAGRSDRSGAARDRSPWSVR